MVYNVYCTHFIDSVVELDLSSTAIRRNGIVLANMAMVQMVLRFRVRCCNSCLYVGFRFRLCRVWI
jgi:hypothetical protein